MINTPNKVCAPADNTARGAFSESLKAIPHRKGSAELSEKGYTIVMNKQITLSAFSDELASVWAKK